MKITLTEPIEQFIRAQLQRGYADPSEIARHALLRWMEEEDAGWAKCDAKLGELA